MKYLNYSNIILSGNLLSLLIYKKSKMRFSAYHVENESL